MKTLMVTLSVLMLSNISGATELANLAHSADFVQICAVEKYCDAAELTDYDKSMAEQKASLSAELKSDCDAIKNEWDTPQGKDQVKELVEVIEKNRNEKTCLAGKVS